MAFATAIDLGAEAPQIQITLLELVQTVSECSNTDAETVATILSMLRSGRVRLNGNFRETLLEDA